MVKFPVLKMEENRVRRQYIGGGGIEKIHGRALKDSDRPEEWVASIVEAKNDGTIEKEGISQVVVQGKTYDLDSVINAEPEYYLGKEQADAIGCQIGVLVKLLDSSVRLAVQAHPDKAYALKYLNSMWGKCEAYYILNIREGIKPYIYLGFNKTLNKEQWKKIIEKQDTRQILSCLNKIEIRQGEVWYIPAGMVHAIGEGITMLEMMEPSDWVIRCEFERIPGRKIPLNERFMGKSLDDVMEVFDLRGYTSERIKQIARLKPLEVEKNDNYLLAECISEAVTDCFEMYDVQIFKMMTLSEDKRLKIVIVIEGEGVMCWEENKIKIMKGDSFFVAASAVNVTIEKEGTKEIRLCIVKPKRYKYSGLHL